MDGCNCPLVEVEGASRECSIILAKTGDTVSGKASFDSTILFAISKIVWKLNSSSCSQYCNCSARSVSNTVSTDSKEGTKREINSTKDSSVNVSWSLLHFSRNISSSSLFLWV